jgi:streptogramin lyase
LKSKLLACAAILIIAWVLPAAYASVVTGLGAYSPGTGFVEYLAASKYASCEDVPVTTKDPIDVGRIQFDSQGNLWTTGRNSQTIYRYLRSERYNHPERFDFDRGGNVWMSAGGVEAATADVLELFHTRNLSELFDDNSSYLVARKDGSLFTVFGGAVEVKDQGSTAVHPLASADAHTSSRRIALDSQDNLWVLQHWEQDTPNQAIELIGASAFKQQKRFPILRRVFGLAVGPHGDIWVTSPEHNAPYGMGLGYNGLKPENLTQLEAEIGYSKQTAFVVPDTPYGVAADSAGNIWTVTGQLNGGNLIELLAASAYSRQKHFDIPGEPYGIAIDKHDNVWLGGAFLNYSKVLELARDKDYAIARTLTSVRSALAMAFDPQGNLWVTNFANQGNLREFVAPYYRSALQYTVDGNPFGLAFDATGNLWVATAGCPSNRIVELPKASNYVKEISLPIDGRPYGVAVDAKGNVWASVAAMPKSTVTEYTRSSGYSAAETFEAAAGFEAALGVDHEGNVWLQDYDYLELEPFPYLPGQH